jgi:two-component system, chemotaxis family, CheB/CheR fusion protein
MSSSEAGSSEAGARQPFLVVTGSSAGGIDALTSFVSHLPDNFTIPIVVAQHLAPTRASHLAVILAQQTTLSVETIAGETFVKPGHIYVVPPDHDVEVSDSIATTRLQVEKGPKPSIDRLFTSAATLYGDRLIAIVLSGLGSDGALGVRAVKRAGGTVIVQDPQSAGFASMPLSIPPTLIDITAAPEAMGRIILDMVGTSEVSPDGTDRTLLRTLLTQLRERSGIDFSQYKTPTIMRRLSRLMVASGVSSIGDYLPYLQRNPEGYQRLVNSFLIKVTEFFRDAGLFDTLRDQILPKLVTEAREQDRELRIWSAGTSTGEEAYSLAILCAELMRDDAKPIDVRIFATDIDEQAVAFARRGIYTADSLRHMPEALVNRYFSEHDERYEVSKQIRNMTVFGQHDLGQRAPFPRIDLVLCRNVLIYFTKDLQARALQLFAFALRDGGYLVLGKAESTTPVPQFFKLVNSGLKIYERDGERVLLPPTRFKDAGQPPPLPAFLRDSTRELRMMHNSNEPGSAPSQDAVAAYMNASVIGVVVVDRNYDIIAINSAARAMLQIHGVGIGSDLIHLLPSMGTKLRSMVDAVFTGDPVEPTVLLAKDPVTGIDRWLQFYVASQRLVGSSFGDTVGIVIVDVTRYERRIGEVENERERMRADMEDHVARADELSARLKAMLTANEELTSINAELRTYNEQLLINAEEAASSNEEIETLNEEMQATNEELETLNEELQATVEELNTTNDELEARSTELKQADAERQARVSKAESERKALALALTSVAPLCAVVSAKGDVYYIAPPVAELTNRESDGAWWREPSLVTLASGRYSTRIGRLDDGLTLVTFEAVR